MGISHVEVEFEAWALAAPVTDLVDRYRIARTNARTIDFISDFILGNEIDVVITNTLVAPWGAIAAWLNQVPHVWFIHEYGNELTFETSRADSVADILALSSLVVCPSETLRNELFGAATNPKFLVHAPIPEALLAIQEVPTEKRAFGDVLNAAMIGQISTAKGQLLALEALEKALSRGAQIQLNLYGYISESEKSAFDSAITARNLESNVTLHGYSEDVLNDLQNNDFGIVASMSEGFGRATLEMLSMGLPVLGSAAGATKELIRNGVNGFLFTSGDAENLSTRLVELYRNRELLELMGNEARKSLARAAKKHDVNEVIRAVSDLEGKSVARATIHYEDQIAGWYALAKEYGLLVKANVDRLLTVLTQATGWPRVNHLGRRWITALRELTTSFNERFEELDQPNMSVREKVLTSSEPFHLVEEFSREVSHLTSLVQNSFSYRAARVLRYVVKVGKKVFPRLGSQDV